jgi:hypothetical protein
VSFSNTNNECRLKQKVRGRGLLKLKIPLYFKICGFLEHCQTEKKWKRCGMIVKKRITTLPD